MASILTVEQKKRVCILARRAWDCVSQAQRDHFLQADGGQTKTAAFDMWRHHQQAVAVGQMRLTASTNDEYCVLMAHFAMLADDPVEAEFWLLRNATDEQRRALYLIKNNCGDGIDWPKYPQAICIAQNKCGLSAATVRQLFNILSTVRNRKALKKQKENHSERQLNLW